MREPRGARGGRRARCGAGRLRCGRDALSTALRAREHPGRAGRGERRPVPAGDEFLPVSADGGKWALERRLERLAQTIARGLQRVARKPRLPRRAVCASTPSGCSTSATRTRRCGGRSLRATASGWVSSGSHVPEVISRSRWPGGPRPGRGGVVRGSDVCARESRSSAGSARVPDPGLRAHELAAAEQRVYERLMVSCRCGAQRLLSFSGFCAARRPRCQRARPRPALAAGRPESTPRPDEGEVAFEPLEQELWRCANARSPSSERTLVVDGEQGRCLPGDARARARSADSPEFPGAGAELCSLRWRRSGSPSTPSFTRAGLVTVTR